MIDKIFEQYWELTSRKKMNLLITGGTGFVGSALCSRLLEEQHKIVVLSRNPEKIKPPIKAVANLDQLSDDDIFDIVINLAGEPIADKRWNDQQKNVFLAAV